MVKGTAVSSFRWVIGFMCACMANACSVPKEARQGAGLLAAYTTEVQTEADRFSAQQLKIDQARLEALGELDENAKATTEHAQRELAIWQTHELGSVKKDFRILLYDSLLASSDLTAQQFREMEIRRNKRAEEINALQAAVNLDSKKLGEIAQALAKLSREPDSRAEIDFLVGYFQDVRKSLEQLRRTAEQEARCAEAEAKGKQCPSEGK